MIIHIIIFRLTAVGYSIDSHRDTDSSVEQHNCKWRENKTAKTALSYWLLFYLALSNLCVFGKGERKERDGGGEKQEEDKKEKAEFPHFQHSIKLLFYSALETYTF